MPVGIEEPSVGGLPPRMPVAMRAYVIGDVHGRADLLLELEERIVRDLENNPTMADVTLIYLGDYVDRGFESRAVLEALIQPGSHGLKRICLIGNHDRWFLEFIRGEPVGASWIKFGGDATLLSYGARLRLDQPEDERLAQAQKELAANVPASHVAFLENLELAFSLGDYFFCHAGIRPNLTLPQQAERDLIWIREPFLSWKGDAGKIIVHGHTVQDEPVIRQNRIGIDTGACFTGVLTSLVLEGQSIRFLQTGSEKRR